MSKSILAAGTAVLLVCSAGSPALATGASSAPSSAASNPPASTSQKPETAAPRQLQLPSLPPPLPNPTPRPQIQFHATGSSRGDFEGGLHYADPQRGISGGASAAIPPSGSPTVGVDFGKRVGPNTTLGGSIQAGPAGNQGTINLNHEFK